ncbi:unnamed protein product [Peronospora farinosa]|uniref:Uncharacterized protein n=1 Tax=Peronospora farinosa TaxID=134698 RepID=A0ABN8CCT1_9STRA|nr:unnamed protein product [Peronospora farinosa]
MSLLCEILITGGELDMDIALHPLRYFVCGTSCTHCPTESDWKLAKKIAKYLHVSKYLRLRMQGYDDPAASISLVDYSDAGFAADKTDRKLVFGGYIKVTGMSGVWVTRKQGKALGLLWKQSLLRRRSWLQK